MSERRGRAVRVSERGIGVSERGRVGERDRRVRCWYFFAVGASHEDDSAELMSCTDDTYY